MKTSFRSRALARHFQTTAYSLFCSQGVSRVSFDTSVRSGTRRHGYASRTNTLRSLLAEGSTGAGALSSVSCCNGNVAFARATRLTDPPIYIPVFRSHSTGFKSSPACDGLSSPENDADRLAIFADTRDSHFESNQKEKKNCLAQNTWKIFIVFNYT